MRASANDGADARTSASGSGATDRKGLQPAEPEVSVGPGPVGLAVE